MIVCPNCNHLNPDGAVQCEACYTPLPATTNCPSCGATVQADAAFCGQCGYNLRTTTPTTVAATVAPDIPLEVPPLVNPDPLVHSETVVTSGSVNHNSPDNSLLPPTQMSVPDPEVAFVQHTPSAPDVETQPVSSEEQSPTPPVTASRTQLQQVTARLVHVQSDKLLELPQNLSVIHIGKLNDRIPPDVDVSGFPNSEIVSRIHADIRVEGDAYYIEDAGSSNGTYINNLPLLPGNRHRLRPGDRISLGKGDLVTFLFQLS
ncbi:MAG: FHA domain-containing protein [Stigonema ocellatum SAG 48.90 = DSM 106950]|nr:FHA domain-containing protein [Stigonema ocellatum SAG 48.90 = DSM 106950]